jgi:hypothetical protein
MATVPWNPHPHYPAYLHGEVEVRVRAFPSVPEGVCEW